jgi:hypothetical protein
MTVDSSGASAACAQNVSAVPNNFGATLLIALGLLTSPLLIGVPLLILGLSMVRSAEGPALPSLSSSMRRLQQGFDGLLGRRPATGAAEVKCFRAE